MEPALHRAALGLSGFWKLILTGHAYLLTDPIFSGAVECNQGHNAEGPQQIPSEAVMVVFCGLDVSERSAKWVSAGRMKKIREIVLTSMLQRPQA